MILNLDKSKVKLKLEEKLNRIATPDEIKNEETDTNLMIEYILEELQYIKNIL